jgi:hypothetical protein
MGHPPFTCRRPAPGRRARWLDIREARCDRFPRSGSNAAELEAAERHMATRPNMGRDGSASPPAGRCSLQRDTNRLQTAAGTVQRGERQPVRGGNRPPGCGVGIRVPVAPSPALPAGHLGAGGKTRGGCAQWQAPRSGLSCHGPLRWVDGAADRDSRRRRQRRSGAGLETPPPVIRRKLSAHNAERSPPAHPTSWTGPGGYR